MQNMWKAKFWLISYWYDIFWIIQEKKDEKCASLHILVHAGEQGQGLQRLMVVLYLPFHDQKADHVLDFKIYLVPSQQQ